MTDTSSKKIRVTVSRSDPGTERTFLVERFKPLTIQALVTAYETAVDEAKRETIRRRTEGG